MVDIYLTEDVKKELSDLSSKSLSRVVKELEILKEHGYKLKAPHVKKIYRKIYELRAVGNPQIRLFFTYKKGDIVIFDFHIKKTQKLPKRVLERVKKRGKQWTT